MVAIYCRQSVDKKDSISIETQEEQCRKNLKENEKDSVQIYSDKGFSGKDTNRPDFLRLMADVEAGRIDKVIVYKIDRISRSVLDFELTYRELKQHNVDFISATENFDTTSITGEATLRIILTFAQLERETIQKRVTDNFYSRAEKGFFMAGRAPLGYVKVEDEIEGKKTSRLQEDPDTSHIIRYVYDCYLNGDSIGTIVSKLNEPNCEIEHNVRFTNVRIARILANPVYVRANADVYAYYKSAGAILYNDVEEFDGLHGLTIYGRRQGKKKSKF
ncbi:MAG: recombinase family protein, partial [Oscillospiraceae bacterium]